MSEPQTAAAPHCRTCRCGAAKKKRSGTAIKRTSADDRFSKMIRERAGYQCQFIDLDTDERCTREFVSNSGGLHAAHCFGRACKVCTGSRGGWNKPHVCTRLDPDNALAMCWPAHHPLIDSDRALKYAIFRWWLGDDRFDQLQAKANAKRDRVRDRISESRGKQP